MKQPSRLAARIAVLALSLASGVSAQPAGPAFGNFGFDAAGMDRAVRPGDDFYAFANGGWTKATPIPADRSNYGAFSVLDDLSHDRSRLILEDAARTRGSKIGDFYASFLDENRVESRGIDPVRPGIAAIRAISTPTALAQALGGGLQIGMTGPIGAGVAIDRKNPDAMVVAIRQAGLGLPDRDYYSSANPAFAKARRGYVTYLDRLLTLIGEENAGARAQAVFDFETAVARLQWDRVRNRQSEQTYNVWTAADFAAKAPGLEWPAFLAAAGLAGQPRYIVSQPDAIAGSAKLIAATPLPVMRDYLLARLLDMSAPYLTRRFVETGFAFRGTVLADTPQIEPRWRRGVDLLKSGMGEAVGQAYVARYFPPETKDAAERLVKTIIAAMDARLAGLAWMEPATRARARAKLASFRPKIGYPDKWRDYGGLTIDRDDLYNNVMRARVFEWEYARGKLGKPADRALWSMTPMEVNAYANQAWNEIVFPAAILQPPFFDPKADAAINYGGIGSVIGHEISHHFDDQGRKYDERGRLATWWTPQDVARFTALTDRLVAQYDAYVPLPGQHLNGRLTLGENMADLAGLTVAYDAYRLSLDGKPAPVIDGFSGDQRFFLGYAQIWRRSYREAELRQRLLTDPHAPSPQRTDIVRNLAPWYDAFDPPTDARLYLAPAQRVRVW